MQIHPLNNTTFKSRNKTIRFADDIARRVNQCYPRISPTKVLSFKNANKFKKFLEDITSITNNSLRFFKGEMYDCTESFYDKIKAFTSPVKHYKLGNCGESAQLAAIVAKTNGIKDCHLAHLCDANGEDLDHAVLFVNDKKPYIIDSWLGIADYVPNMINRYKNEYYDIFELEKDDAITFASFSDDEYTDFLKNDFSRKQINKLKKIYPNLFIKRGYI